ncbi:hypothetical protein H0H87_006587 [Tephrocybe sp. NHM501043]|nr:hypothetical protein H0H87_006587 [Tephrocybe sp. NHM501043]
MSLKGFKLEDEKTADHISDVEPQTDSYWSDHGYDRAYGAKCDLRLALEDINFNSSSYQGLDGWQTGVAIVLGQVQQELLPVRVEFATLALCAGLIPGAFVWGVTADVIGRKLAFNVRGVTRYSSLALRTHAVPQITLFLAGVFGIAAGGANNFVAFAACVACLGFGLGGNLPVDGTLYLENVPQKHQWTLTLLSAWWAIGQLVASLIAWGFIGNFSCDSTLPAGECLKADNMGWRYTFYTYGAMTILMFISRFLIFDLQESAKYLVAKGRDDEAIRVLKHIARKNGRTISLTLEHLEAIEPSTHYGHKTTTEVLKGAFSGISLSHIKPLFGSRKLAINSILIILCWGLIGLAFPLFNSFLPLYLAQHMHSATSSVDATYRNYAIISTMGIPGSMIACLIVDRTRNSQSKWTVGGRKMTMAMSTALTGIFLFLFTTSKTDAAVLGWSCASGLTQNAMYGVLFAYTPEVFPAPHRGTGDAIASSFNRITGILAPVIKIATTTADGGAIGGASPNGYVTYTFHSFAGVFT